MATAAPADSKAPAPKTVAEDMPARRIFKTADEAIAYLNLSGETFTDFGDIPLASPGVDDEGNFNPAVYADGFEVMVAKLTNKSKVKAIVVAPVPSLELLMGTESGAAFVRAIIHKELNHRAVRALREAEDVSTVVDQIPVTVTGYIESGRGDGGIMESFNELYKQINTLLSAKLPVWAKARLVKSELKKALESKGYAAEFYPALEEYKAQGIESGLFVTALELGINSAKRKGMDPTIFERWKATRDQKVYVPGETDGDEDEEQFSIESLTDALLADDKPAEAPAPDAAAETDATDTGAAA